LTGCSGVTVYSIDAASGLDVILSQRAILTSRDAAELAPVDAPSRLRCAARIVLRLALSRHIGAGAARKDILPGASGRPEIPDIPWCFSISHTDGLALVALSQRRPLGVDIERDRPIRVSADRAARLRIAMAQLCCDPPNSAERIPSEGGYRLENQTAEPGRNRLIDAWVQLEALAKADGRGIHWLLQALGVVGVGDPTARAEVARLLSQCVLRRLPEFANAAAAIAYPRSDPDRDCAGAVTVAPARSLLDG